jgi:hypothetical protein
VGVCKAGNRSACSSFAVMLRDIGEARKSEMLAEPMVL